MASEREPRRRRWLAVGLAALLFATGVAAGAAGDRWVAPRDGHGGRGGAPWWVRHRPEVLARRYREELRLDEAQARAVEAVLGRAWTATRQAFAPVERDVMAIRRRGDDEIRAILRPEQRARFDKIVAEREERRAAIRRQLDAPRP
jgi:hypothetical protein